jgi:signal transduction histidine kinase
MGIIFFQVLKNLSLTDLNRELENLREIVDEYLADKPFNPPERIPGIDSISFEPAMNGRVSESGFNDTLMFDSRTGQYRTYRFLRYQSGPPGAYSIKIFKSTTPNDKLVEWVTLMMTMMVILFLAGIFFMNRFIFANLWKDFFNALDKLRDFDTLKEPVVLEEPDVEEFIELKNVLEKMTRRLAGEYRELREYTDHTTHELQTPLAVIKTKTELLLQSDNLGKNELQLIQAINANINHLSRLNSTLALITRIENRQFTGREEINLVILLEHHLEMFQEMIFLKGIKVVRNYAEGGLNVVMDKGLADILVANVVKNAIIHNLEKGAIEIETTGNSLSICNDGDKLSFGEEELFRRFVRDTRKTGNFGLGLSLVKKICDYYGFMISYNYQDRKHHFKILLRDY